MRLDGMKPKWSPFLNMVIAAARSNGIHQRKIGYKYDQSKWGLYKRMQPTVIQNDYISAIWFTANPQHQMCSIKLWAVRALAGLKLSTLSGTNIDCAVYVSAFSAVKKITAETCRCVCLHAERTSLCLFFARLYRMYVCVVGRAGKQALGWEGGRTPSTQIIDTILAERNASRSKKSGWWSSALQSDPLHPTRSGEKRTETRLPGTRLYLFVQLYPCLF